MVEDLIRRARRRFVLNESLAQFAFAAAVSVAGFALVLILGTRFLEWWSFAVFVTAGIGIGLYRVYTRTPDSYTTAIRLDSNASLQDALSTALYFSSDVSNHDAISEEFRSSQRRQAENSAGTVQLDRAVPFLVPRSLYAMAALCVLASVLIGLRYRAGHGLDLRAPITQFLFEDQATRDVKKAPSPGLKSQKWMDEAQSLLSKLGMAPNPQEPTPGDPDSLDKAIEQALQNPADPSSKSEKGAASGKGGESKAGDKSDPSASGDPMDKGEESAKDQNDSEGSTPKEGDQGSKTGTGKNGAPSNRESLLSRLKDAVSNMLSKTSKEDNASSSQKNQQSAKNESQSGEKGQQAGKGAQDKGESQADGQDGQPDADAQNGQQAQGKLNSAANQTPTQGGSGIGNQDGSKEMKAAAQLKAMGKISEIIGQRAATVSGETSVEVQSGNQKLHTAYSTTAAAHGETDGDVTRDEIPLSLQSYVQQYFAEVHKQKAGTRTAPAKTP
jgi:hypothetical protein